VPLLLLAIFLVLAVIALIPISIVQRFRSGTARRPARAWVAALNLGAVAFSVLLFVFGALVTTRWVPEALRYTLAGLGLGSALGFAGIVLTRWERVRGRLHYTPNRWLVLAVTLVVAARVCYGFWRSWEAWRASVESMTWVAASGVAGSMSGGAVVLGYYLVFWAGVGASIRRNPPDRRPG
jgi:hypothetical protein